MAVLQDLRFKEDEMKRILITSASILINTFCMTSSHAIYYLGMNAQKNFAHWQFETPTGDNHFNFNGINSRIFGGYGCILDPNFYFGGEIFADFIPIKTSHEIIDEISYQADAKYGVGLRFIAGHYIFPATFIFISAGVIDTKFSFTEDLADGTSLDETSTALAAQYAFGIQTKIYKKIDARLEYTYANYQSFNSFGNEIFPQNNQINFGLIYRIN
jgi:opacity protein-like surface antigen